MTDKDRISVDLSILPADCKILEALSKELRHQEDKYGKDKQQSFAGFVLVIEKELQEVKDGWMRSIQEGRDSPCYEMLQVAAVAWACLRKYGLEGCPGSTDDEEPTVAKMVAKLQKKAKKKPVKPKLSKTKHIWQDYTECCILCGHNAYEPGLDNTYCPEKK